MTENTPQIKGELGLAPFDIITGSEILTSNDFEKLVPLTEELQHTFEKSQVFRTKTEMVVSVLNDTKHPTPSSKYWQAVREQNVMFTEMVMLSYEYRKQAIEIKKLKRDILKEEDELERELLQIEIEKLTFMSKQQEKVAKDRIREIVEWSGIKEEWASKMSEVELADVNNHQLVSYTKRWMKQLAAGGQGSPSEQQNLIGQLNAGIKHCKENGLLPEIIKDAPPQLKAQLEAQLQLEA